MESFRRGFSRFRSTRMNTTRTASPTAPAMTEYILISEWERVSIAKVMRTIATSSNKAPALSRVDFPAGTVPFGTAMSISGTATNPRGMLIRKIQFQSVKLTMAPPRAGPMANPIEAPMVTMERPKASFSGGRWTTQHMGPAAAIMPAPTAWAALAAMSMGNETEMPQKSELIVKIARPRAMMSLMPLSAAILAKATRVPARIIM